MSGGGTGTGICSMQVQQLLKELNFRLMTLNSETEDTNYLLLLLIWQHQIK
jgi:hypothetical protein